MRHKQAKGLRHCGLYSCRWCVVCGTQDALTFLSRWGQHCFRHDAPRLSATLSKLSRGTQYIKIQNVRLDFKVEGDEMCSTQHTASHSGANCSHCLSSNDAYYYNNILWAARYQIDSALKRSTRSITLSDASINVYGNYAHLFIPLNCNLKPCSVASWRHIGDGIHEKNIYIHLFDSCGRNTSEAFRKKNTTHEIKKRKITNSNQYSAIGHFCVIFMWSRK